MTEVTKDAFFDGQLQVTQSLAGYRFSIDAVLLAAAIRPKPGESILDMGTGCGIIPLILVTRYPGVQITGVEVQAELARLAQLNVDENRCDDQIKIRHVDLKLLPDPETPGPYDWIVTNPPYRRPQAGRVNPNEQRALARFELKVDLVQWMQTAARLLKVGGRLVTIYSAERTVDLLCHMRQAAIEPKWMQAVQSYCGDPAKLVLVKGIQGGRPGLDVATPLVVYERDGRYSETVQEMMRP